MQKNPFKTTLLSLALISLAGLANAQWVAYNDHSAGTAAQTAANATTNDMRTAGGPYSLKNITNGSIIPATMTVTVAGGAPVTGGTGGNPNSATPLYNTFNTFCYFGANVLQISNIQTNTIIFSGLNPLNRYKFQAGACRGGSAYTNRWAKFNILGTQSFTANHRQSSTSPMGIFTASDTSYLTGNEVAINTGYNVAGDMVEWDDIVPNTDGTFSVTSSQWANSGVSFTGHGVYTGTFYNSGANYAYALDAFRLEEIPPAGPISISVQPTNTTVVLGEPFSLDVRVTGALPYYYAWFKGSPGTFISNATNQTYTVASSVGTDDAWYYAIVSNNTSRATSAVIRVTITNSFPIQITSQPASKTIPLGQPVTFTVGVTGTKPHFQWYKGKNQYTVTLPNATNASYTIQSVAASDATNYFVVITNINSFITSADAYLTVDTNRQILFIARTNLNPGDIVMSNRLAALGATVVVKDDRSVSQTDANGKALIAISSSVSAYYIGEKFTAFTAVPLICWSAASFTNLWFTAQDPTDYHGTIPAQQGIAIWDPTSPLAGGLNNTQRVFSTPDTLSYGVPTANALVTAVSTNGTNQAVIFSYEKGATLCKNNWPAPARRVGFFLNEIGATNLTAAGSTLLSNALQWAIGTPIASSTPVGFSKNPASISIVEGTSCSFSANVTGAPPYYLQWRRNGANIPGATSRILNVGPVSASDNNAQFTLWASNKVPSTAISAAATLTVLAPNPIVITSPPQNLAKWLGDTATFTVGFTGTAPHIQWSRNGITLTNETNATLTILNASAADAGTYTVTITNRVSSPSASAILAIIEPNIVLVAPNAQWSYFTNGVEPTGDWKSLAYNDSSWPQGAGAFAYPANENLLAFTRNTTLPRTVTSGGATNNINTIYFRAHFTWNNDPAGMTIYFTNAVDDGAIIYLNGVEIRRLSMPSGAVNYSTYATRANDISDSGHGLETFTISPFQLQDGDNVVAVELHDGSATSSDIAFGCSINAVFAPPTMLAISNQPQNITLEEARTATFTVGVSGSGGRYLWYKDDVLIPGATRDYLTISNLALGDSGNYYVTVSNAFSFVTSRTAVLTVIRDVTAPTLFFADGSLSSTNILLSFSEAVSSATATVTNNYILTNVTAGGTNKITKATLVNGTNVMLTTASARTNGANYVLIVSKVRDVTPQQNMILDNSMIPVSTATNLIDWVYFWHYYVPKWETYGCDVWPEQCDTSHIDLHMDWLAQDYEPPWPVDQWSAPGTWWGENTSSRGAFFTSGNQELPLPTGVPLGETRGVISYFRTHFTNDSSPVGLHLKLQYLVDDGAVFYINGVEIHRVNMGTNVVHYDTTARSNVTSMALSDIIEVPNWALRQGDNIMCVEVHSAGSLDVNMAFDMQLTALRQSVMTGALRIVSSPLNQSVAEGQPATFSFTALAALGCQWYTNNVLVPGATNDTFTIPKTAMAMNGLSVYVVAINSTNSVTSSNAILTVVPDTTPPELVGAYAITTTTIMVYFSEAMDPQSTTNGANYTLKNSSGQIVLIMKSIVLVNGGSNVLITLDPMNDTYTLVINGARDASSNKNYIEENSTATVGMQVLIPFISPWKYDNRGVDLSTNWIPLSFNDNSWPVSNAFFYVTSSDSALSPFNTHFNTTNDSGTYIITFYFRQHFIAPMAASNVTLSITHVIDDGVVFYLNGVEFNRFNMPAGQPTYNTQGTSAIEPAYMGPYETKVNVLAGDNVIAAEVHQSGLNSSDMGFGAQISITLPSNRVYDSGTNVPCPSVLPALAYDKLVIGNQMNLRLQWLGTNWFLDRTTNLCCTNAANTIWTPVQGSPFPLFNNSYIEPMTNSPGTPIFFRLRYLCNP